MRSSTDSTAHRRRSFAVVALAALTAVLAGCGTAAVSIAPSVPVTRHATASPSRAIATVGASPAAGDRAPTFPLSQTPIEPGTYSWVGFERPISLAVGSGWEIGHDNPAFFDLFRGSDFPSVSFARFTDVYAAASRRTPATDSATVATTLARRTDMTVTNPMVIELAGLPGRQFDVATLAPQTPLFHGPAGVFQLDPVFRTRYRVLDVPGGGVLVIGVHARDGEFDAALALTDPLVATLKLEP